jgi:hypothetical protein
VTFFSLELHDIVNQFTKGTILYRDILVKSILEKKFEIIFDDLESGRNSTEETADGCRCGAFSGCMQNA